MTKCRRHFSKRLLVDRYPLHLACHSAAISKKTGYRWFCEQRLTLRQAPSRFRKSIPGVMIQRDQNILFIIVKRNPSFHYDENAYNLFEETGHASSKLQILEAMSRADLVYKLANEQAPIERDLEFRRLRREQVIYQDGPLRAEDLLYVDGTQKNIVTVLDLGCTVSEVGMSRRLFEPTILVFL